jgi:hypothetical protein
MEKSQILAKVAPDRLNRFDSAGPSGPISFLNIIPDIGNLIQHGIWDNLRKYVLVFQQGKPEVSNVSWNNSSKFLDVMSSAENMYRRSLLLPILFKAKTHVGKLAFKEEAAGKLRIFAIVDSWTQSVFKNLHKYLFEILRAIPNDSTFNQAKGINRLNSLIKVNGLKKVYSFDLSAATDRLPIDLQADILSSILKDKAIGPLWKEILVDRDFFIRKNQYGLSSGVVRYAVGQPMGALSS